jgi:hypothetical protein
LSICWSDIVENFQMTEPKLPIKWGRKKIYPWPPYERCISIL